MSLMLFDQSEFMMTGQLKNSRETCFGRSDDENF